MDSKIKIAVIMGGMSSEHDISLASGQGIINNLDYNEYAVCPVIITKEGRWHCAEEYAGFFGPTKFDPGKFLEKVPEGTKTFPIFLLAQDGRPDVVLPILHGRWGEDGTLQGLLSIYGLDYTGSSVLASSLAIHKRKAKEMYQQYNLNTPAFSFYPKSKWETGRADIPGYVMDKLGLPVFVKIPDGGSSIGLGMASSKEEIQTISDKLFEEADEVMFEKYVKGTEVSCGVLESASGDIEALMPTEIVPVKSSFFDFEAKYNQEACREITPARISPALIQKVQNTAVTAHRALNCSDFSRTDMIISGSKIFVLETNTLPGFTETSLLPQGAAAAGITYQSLLDRIIGCALKRAKSLS
jgi:D-alanine-D-alanine ligase